MKKAILIILVLCCFLSVNVYPIDEATVRKQLEQKIDKIKKDTPVFVKHWDGTEFYVTFVCNPKDAQPDVILVRIWGKVLPMEKVLIEEIKKR